jgi:hypothetical protein
LYWKKVAEALFSDITSSAAGKKLLLRSQHSHIPVQQRDFCRLPRASLSVAVRPGWQIGKGGLRNSRPEPTAIDAGPAHPVSNFPDTA